MFYYSCSCNFTAEVQRVNTRECKLARLSYGASSQTVLSGTDRYRVFSNDSSPDTL